MVTRCATSAGKVLPTGFIDALIGGVLVRWVGDPLDAAGARAPQGDRRGRGRGTVKAGGVHRHYNLLASAAIPQAGSSGPYRGRGRNENMAPKSKSLRAREGRETTHTETAGTAQGTNTRHSAGSADRGIQRKEERGRKIRNRQSTERSALYASRPATSNEKSNNKETVVETNSHRRQPAATTQTTRKNKENTSRKASGALRSINKQWEHAPSINKEVAHSGQPQSDRKANATPAISTLMLYHLEHGNGEQGLRKNTAACRRRTRRKYEDVDQSCRSDTAAGDARRRRLGGGVVVRDTADVPIQRRALAGRPQVDRRTTERRISLQRY